MPAYDYRCTVCDERFEITRPMGSKSDETCPVCDAPAKRIFSPVGVAFKGTGFHNTDYKPRPKEDAPAPSCPAKSDSSSCASCPVSSAD